MRVSVGAVAIICRENDGQAEWLAQWNEGWQAYHFVGGHKHDDETFRECIVREIGEELGLACERDVRVSQQAIRHLEYQDISRRNGELTQYVIELYSVELVSDQAASIVDSDSDNRWLTEHEILSERCRDGQPVSPTPKRFLSELLGHVGSLAKLPACQSAMES